MLGVLGLLQAPSAIGQLPPAASPLGRTFPVPTSFRCTVVGEAGGKPLRLEIAQDRTRRLLRVFEPDGRTIRAEYRNWGSKVVVWSPSNKHHYLRTHVEGPFGFAEPLRLFLRRTEIESLALLPLVSGHAVFVRERLSPESTLVPSRLPDGTPVVVLSTPYYSTFATGKRGGILGIEKLYIGTQDGLLRRVEPSAPVERDRHSSGGFQFGASGEGDRRTSTWWEFRDIHADRPIPESLFAFRSPKGTRPIEEPKGFPSHLSTNYLQLSNFIAYLHRLETLRFRTEWSHKVYVTNGSRSVPVGDDSARTEFSLAAPETLKGSIRWKEADKLRRIELEILEYELRARYDDGTGLRDLPPRTKRGRFEFGREATPLGRGAGAELVACAFLASKSYVSSELGDFIPVRHKYCENLHVFMKVDEPVDALGIPTGRRTVRRLVVDGLTHLPRRYESIEESDLPGEPSRIVITERFLEVDSHLKMVPS